MNITVLYVDDEAIPRLIFEKSFEAKYSILVAGSGQEALDKMAKLEDEFVVAITDMRMPEMDGIEFVTAARKQYEHLECFILTSLDQDDNIDQAIADQLIKKSFNKPLNVQEIDAAIKEATAHLA